MPDRFVAEIRGAGEPVIVFDRGQYRCLRMANNQELIQGYQHRYRRLDFRSEYLQGHIAASLARANPRRALCLGLGVGAIPQLLSHVYPNVDITAVELNDTVLKAASDYFALKQLTDLTTEISCAAQFVNDSSNCHYDLIFVDCYDSIGIPSACGSNAFVNNVMARLSPGGLVIANLLPGRRLVNKMFELWVSSGADAAVIPGVLKSNRTLICSNQTLPTQAHVIRRLDALTRSPLPFDPRKPWLRLAKAERYLGQW